MTRLLRTLANVCYLVLAAIIMTILVVVPWTSVRVAAAVAIAGTVFVMMRDS